MISVKFDDSEIRAALKRLAEASANLKPPMQDIGEYLRSPHPRG